MSSVPPVPAGSSAAARELAQLTAELLEALRTRTSLPVSCVPPLEAALLAERLFSGTREREGIVRFPGEMTVDVLQAPEDVGTFATVDVAATIKYPGEDYREGSRALDPTYKVPSFPSTTTEVGPVTFQRAPGGWRLTNYVIDGKAMSASWCTHPSGEDRVGGADGIAAVAQAVRKRDKRTGAIYIEVSNGSDSDVVVAIGPPADPGRPSRLTRLLRRTAGADPENAAPRGLFVAAGDVGHLAGRTIHPADTDVILTAYDDATRVPVAQLSLAVKLADGHPGTDDDWCGYPPVT